jgi:hypothetical protein
MKQTIRLVGGDVPLHIEEVDVDGSDDLKARFGHEVPVLFIDDRKVFKYRLTEQQLRRKLTRPDVGRRPNPTEVL